MRVALLSLYNADSYGIRMLRNYIEGHEVKSFFFNNDSYKDQYDEKELLEFLRRIMDWEPQYLFIGVHSPVALIAERICKELKGRVVTVLGGPHPTAAPDKCRYADYICVGSFVDAIKIINSRCDNRVLYRNACIDPNLLPYMYYGRDDVYSDRQMKFNILTSDRFSMFTSTGCFFNCTYCHESTIRDIFGSSKVIRKTHDRLFDEIKYMRKEAKPYAIEISYSDHIFTQDHEWIREFAKRNPKEGLPFRCFGHMATVTDDMIGMLVDAGLTYISFGIQHINKDICKKLGRKVSMDRVFYVSDMLSRHGVHARYDIIRNIPWETQETRRELDLFLNSLPTPHTIRNFEMRWFPNTRLTNTALAEKVIMPEQVEGNFIRLGDWSYNYTKY